MSTISRRSFLKLAGVTAVATAGASMLTGCSLVKYVTIIPILNGEVIQGESLSVPLPGFIENYDWAFDMVIPIVKKKYANIPGFNAVQFELDKTFRDANNIPSCRVFTDSETGKDMMYLAVKCNVINGERVTSGKHSFPKGVTSIDEATARKIIAEVGKNNDKVPTNYEFDSSVANNLKVVDGKIIVALKV